MSRRTRYQQGSVQREKRQSGSDVWVFRWWESTFDGTSKRRKAIVGTIQAFPTRSIRTQSRKSLAHRRQPTNPALVRRARYDCRTNRSLPAQDSIGDGEHESIRKPVTFEPHFDPTLSLTVRSLALLKRQSLPLSL